MEKMMEREAREEMTKGRAKGRPRAVPGQRPAAQLMEGEARMELGAQPPEVMRERGRPRVAKKAWRSKAEP